MCQLLPIEELKNMKFSISSLANMVGTPGSYDKENAENISRGMKARLQWVIDHLEANKEGRKIG